MDLIVFLLETADIDFFIDFFFTLIFLEHSFIFYSHPLHFIFTDARHYKNGRSPETVFKNKC